MEMTQEEKDLLNKDLSGRLPYGVKVRCMSVGESMPQVWNLIGMPTQNRCDILVPNERRFSAVPIQDVKPYLRPISSMTKEEKKEWIHLREIVDKYIDGYHVVVDFYNKHHFDYRCLIEDELAIEAPEGMYEFSDNTIENE